MKRKKRSHNGLIKRPGHSSRGFMFSTKGGRNADLRKRAKTMTNAELADHFNLSIGRVKELVKGVRAA